MVPAYAELDPSTILPAAANPQAIVEAPTVQLVPASTQTVASDIQEPAEALTAPPDLPANMPAASTTVPEPTEVMTGSTSEAESKVIKVGSACADQSEGAAEPQAPTPEATASLDKKKKT